MRIRAAPVKGERLTDSFTGGGRSSVKRTLQTKVSKVFTHPTLGGAGSTWRKSHGGHGLAGKIAALERRHGLPVPVAGDELRRIPAQGRNGTMDSSDARSRGAATVQPDDANRDCPCAAICRTGDELWAGRVRRQAAAGAEWFEFVEGNIHCVWMVRIGPPRD